MRVTVLNGPNLNLLGTREPHIYGTTTLSQLEALVREEAHRLGASIRFIQTNHEGTLIDEIQKLPATADGLILNAGAYSHTSLAIRDALLAVKVPFVEVHLTDVASREEARRRLVFADLAVQLITGEGPPRHQQPHRPDHRFSLRWAGAGRSGRCR
jgi:3-dehydroquinate dehydratase-2